MNIDKEIEYSEIIKKIWCGTLKEIKQDIGGHSAKLLIEVLDSGIKQSYELIFLGISSFKISYDHSEENWDYVELTEVDIKKHNSMYQTEIDLWSSGKMTVECKDMQCSRVD